MEYKFIKQVQDTQKLGKILPIDFDSQNLNQTNLAREIFIEIQNYIESNIKPDYIWLKGIGDPSYYVKIKELIKLIKEKYPAQKIGLNLNCAVFQYAKLRKNLIESDFIAINLNSLDPYNFAEINNCHECENPMEILKGIKEFSRLFKGHSLGIYTLLLKGINDNPRNIQNLKHFLLDVKPDHYSISNYTFNGFEPISDEFKTYLKEVLKDLPFEVIYVF